MHTLYIQIDIISLLVEATENSIENREAGLPACGPFESVLLTMGEDGRRIEEERDRLKDKIIHYEERINDVCHHISSTIDDSSHLLNDLSISLNPFDCLQRLEVTAGALVHQNTKRNIKSKTDGLEMLSMPPGRNLPMDEEEKSNWIDNYHKKSSDHLSNLRMLSRNLTGEWPRDRNCPFLPYETAILLLLARSNEILTHNSNMRCELEDLRRSFDGKSVTYSMASDTSQWRNPRSGQFDDLRNTLLSPFRRFWKFSKKHLRRMGIRR
ncbi:hypothetical protein PRIPAC_93644 [Pristionchus pacificus]|nr:hypothetical protein PRIPAC_93644 [Pristionchus pacificus]|eukprot:PDM62899.1 hypothetical protein PRIPAC_50114 [Pristionchus pacificus]